MATVTRLMPADFPVLSVFAINPSSLVELSLLL